MKFKNIRGYSNGKIKFKNIQDFRRPVRTLITGQIASVVNTVHHCRSFVFWLKLANNCKMLNKLPLSDTQNWHHWIADSSPSKAIYNMAEKFVLTLFIPTTWQVNIPMLPEHLWKSRCYKKEIHLLCFKFYFLGYYIAYKQLLYTKWKIKSAAFQISES